jgi:hypothetical protein
MNLPGRVKKIVLKPKEEWIIIESEETKVVTLIFGYLIPLSFISALAAFVGYELSGSPILTSAKNAAILFIQTFFVPLIVAWIINSLSSSFASRNDFRRTLQLIVYSLTPMMVAGIFYVMPKINILVMFAGVYGLYLLFTGIKPIMHTPEDKVAPFFVVSILVLMGVYFILGAILSLANIGVNIAFL